MEWAIEHVKTYGKPVAATICIGPNGDEDGVPLGRDLFRNIKQPDIFWQFYFRYIPSPWCIIMGSQ